ncbi:MAG: sel1 repeat family protein [Planctomycetes bacterium]|nr:sel1 repeat family protein [Planctomycetota bacterium]
MTRAFALLRRSAQLGSGSACVNLGLGYRSGLGGKVDVGLARNWLGLASEQGHAVAQAALSTRA